MNAAGNESGGNSDEDATRKDFNLKIQAIAAAHRDEALAALHAETPASAITALRSKNASAAKSSVEHLLPPKLSPALPSILRQVFAESEEEAMQLFEVAAVHREKALAMLRADEPACGLISLRVELISAMKSFDGVSPTLPSALHDLLVKSEEEAMELFQEEQATDSNPTSVAASGEGLGGPATAPPGSITIADGNLDSNGSSCPPGPCLKRVFSESSSNDSSNESVGCASSIEPAKKKPRKGDSDTKPVSSRSSPFDNCKRMSKSDELAQVESDGKGGEEHSSADATLKKSEEDVSSKPSASDDEVGSRSPRAKKRADPAPQSSRLEQGAHGNDSLGIGINGATERPSASHAPKDPRPVASEGETTTAPKRPKGILRRSYQAKLFHDGTGLFLGSCQLRSDAALASEKNAIWLKGGRKRLVNFEN